MLWEFAYSSQYIGMNGMSGPVNQSHRHSTYICIEGQSSSYIFSSGKVCLKSVHNSSSAAREWTTKAAATLFVNLWSVENKWKVVGCLCWGWEPSCWCVLCVKSLGDWNATSFSLPNSHISCVLSVRKIKVTANRFYRAPRCIGRY